MLGGVGGRRRRGRQRMRWLDLPAYLMSSAMSGTRLRISTRPAAAAVFAGDLAGLSCAWMLPMQRQSMAVNAIFLPPPAGEGARRADGVTSRTEDPHPRAEPSPARGGRRV